MLSNINRIILITACVLYFGNDPVKGQIYESGDNSIYLTLDCNPDPNGAGLQNIPADIASIDGEVACAVSESDEFIEIVLDLSITGFEDDARRKRAVNNPDYTNFSGERTTERRFKRQIGTFESDFEYTYLMETTSVQPQVQPEFSAFPGQDYGHVSIPWDFFPTPSSNHFKVPLVQDNAVEEDELFQVNVYDLVGEYYFINTKRDTSSMFPCVKILIVDDDVNFQFGSPMYPLDHASSTATVSILKSQGTLATRQSLTLTAEDISNSDNAVRVTPEEVPFTNAEAEIVEHTINIITSGELPKAVKIEMRYGIKGALQYPSQAILRNLIETVSAPLPFALDLANYVVREGDSFQVTVYRTGDLFGRATVDLVTDNINAVDLEDYRAITIPISFATGVNHSDPISIISNEDNQVESVESFELALLSDGNKVSASTVFIVDNDVDYCFESQTYMADEGDGSISITLLKKGNPDIGGAIRIQTSDGDAVFPSDYDSITEGGSSEALSSPLSWPVGEDKLVIDVAIVDDNESEWPQVEFFNVHVVDDDDILCSTKVLIKDDDAKCNPPCSNGGLCVGHDKCLCLDPYIGPTCSEMCTCQNNGFCLPQTHECWCPTGYTGAKCETSLCNPGCQNGGICSAAGACFCPAGYTGLQCQTVSSETDRIIAGQFSITSINGALAIFTAALNVDGSTEQVEFLAMVMPILRMSLNQPGVTGVTIMNFKPGSIVVEYNVMLKPNSQIGAEDIGNSINNGFIQSAAASGIIVDTSSAVTFTREVCPDGYCANGGTCTADSNGVGSICSCTSDYYGSQCQNRRDSDGLGPGGTAGFVIGVFAVVGIAILVILVGYVYFKRSQNKATAVPNVPNFPTIDTLDLASREYTNQRDLYIQSESLMF